MKVPSTKTGRKHGTTDPGGAERQAAGTTAAASGPASGRAAPDRDDVARAKLFWAITGYLKEGRPDRIEQLADAVTALLAEQSFDERASYGVFDDLVDRYARNDQPFRRKPHLRG